MLAKTGIRDFLVAELNKRKAKNKNYSMRAMARDFGLSPGRLGDVLNGRRLIGPRLARRILETSSFSESKKNEFRRLLLQQQKTKSKNLDLAYQLREDELKVLVDWEYFAVLSLLETKSVKHSAAWIAERLNITLLRAEEVLKRLERLELIVLKRRKYHLVHKKVMTTTDVPSASLKEAHRQNIQQAVTSLFNDPVNVRDVSSISLAVNIEKLPQAKKMITEFRQKLSRCLEKGNKTEVYNLNIQLFPITQKVR